MKLEVTSILHTTPDSTTLRFNKTKELEQHKPGQHGMFMFSIDGQRFLRSYSFHSVNDLDNDVAITVRSIRDGIVSNYLSNLNTTDIQVELTGVAGDFYIVPSVKNIRHIVMFAAGSGITPLAAMCKGILFQEPDSLVTLIYSNRNAESILLKDELTGLEHQFPTRFKVYHVFTKSEESPNPVPVFFKGRLSKLIVRKTVKSLLSERETKFYLCGPKDFMAIVEDGLRSLAISDDKIFKETFFAADETSKIDFNNLPLRDIVLQTSKGDQHITVEMGKSILQAGLENGIALKYSCTQGQCGTCRATLISGEVRLKQNHILTHDELSADQILLCQGFPVSDGVVIRTSV